MKWVRDLYFNGRTFEPPPLFSNLPHTINKTLHLSFDFAQNMCYPHDPLQPGPLYFLVERKVHLFGICCEAIPRQVNYLMDEAHCIGKGANTVISLLHYYLSHHSLGEKHIHLHADNCVGQNKNNYLIRVSFLQNNNNHVKIIIQTYILFHSTVHGLSFVAYTTVSHCHS